MRKSVCILTMALMFGTVALAMAADTKAPATKDQGTMAAPAGSTTTTTTDTTTKTKTTTTKCKAGMGTIASKEDSAKSFVVHPKKGDDMTFMTNDKTKYWENGKTSDWAGVTVGDHTSVTCGMDGTNMVAKTVKSHTPKAPKAPKAPKTTG
jgi:hypothetical protein